MYKPVTEISGLLSLRSPLTKSLEILAGIADLLSLQKDCDLAIKLKKVKAHTAKLAKATGATNVCSEFVRDFPRICFAIDTGVGKTRLAETLQLIC